MPAPSGVPLHELALLLWEAASLCHWHPSWSRDWGRCRYQLLGAAAGFTLQDRPLERLLFVPRPYRPVAATTLNAQWRAFVQGLAPTPRGGVHLLVAPLRALQPPSDQHSATAWLRHLRDPVELTAGCWDFLAAQWRAACGAQALHSQPSGALTRAPRTRDAQPELVGFFRVSRTASGRVMAGAGWLLPVHPPTAIPVANRNALRLVDALHLGGYAFQRLPSTRPARERDAPDLLVRHVRGPDGLPVARAALEVLAPSAPEAFVRARANLARELATQGVPTWLWTPTGSGPDRSVPPLPPRSDVPAADAQAQLRRLAACAQAGYAFGFPERLTPARPPSSQAH